MPHYELTDLDPSKERSFLLQHIPKELHKILKREQSPLAVKLGDKIVAFALFRKLASKPFAESHWFWVDEENQNDEVISLLINDLERKASEKAPGLLIIYDNEAIEEALLKHGWDDPEYFQLHILFDAKNFDAPWLHHRYKIPSEYEIFPWMEVTEEEKKLILGWKEANIIPIMLSPYNNEELIEPRNSLGLRFKGQIVGWIVTRLINADTIEYTTFFTLPEHRSLGPNISMLAESIRTHVKQIDVPWATLEINYPQADHRWISFIERRLIPYSTKHYHFYKIFKKL